MIKELYGYEGVYTISDSGEVYNIEYNVVKSQRVNKKWYPFLCLKHKGVRKTFEVHRILARTFLWEPWALEVNHIDGDKQNNHISNLEYVTRSENMKHAFRLWLAKKTDSQKKELSKRMSIPVEKLKDWIVVATYTSRLEAAKENGVDDSSICACCSGKLKTVWGFVYRNFIMDNNENAN